jgi:hypothetical protein
MRLWTVHPRYLDPRGLVALWREALLAQKVLRGETVGYTAHPQLIRFRQQRDPLAAIATYLAAVHDEALFRGYQFDATRIGPDRSSRRIPETDGQLRYEWQHLRAKLEARSVEFLDQLENAPGPEPHPLFRIIPGDVRAWERVRDEGSG